MHRPIHRYDIKSAIGSGWVNFVECAFVRAVRAENAGAGGWERLGSEITGTLCILGSAIGAIKRTDLGWGLRDPILYAEYRIQPSHSRNSSIFSFVYADGGLGKLRLNSPDGSNMP
jgi:hypothetical protein